METPTQERFDEVSGRLGSLVRSMARIDDDKLCSRPSNRKMKRIAVRFAILTSGYVMLQSEIMKANAIKAAA